MVSFLISNVTASYKYPQHQTVRVFVEVLLLQQRYISGVLRIRSRQAESSMELFVPSFKGIATLYVAVLFDIKEQRF